MTMVTRIELNDFQPNCHAVNFGPKKRNPPEMLEL